MYTTTQHYLPHKLRHLLYHCTSFCTPFSKILHLIVWPTPYITHQLFVDLKLISQPQFHLYEQMKITWMQGLDCRMADLNNCHWIAWIVLIWGCTFSWRRTICLYILHWWSFVHTLLILQWISATQCTSACENQITVWILHLGSLMVAMFVYYRNILDEIAWQVVWK